MDIIITLVLIALYIVILIFSFALGMLTKLIRKRDIGIVILIGFIIGAIGGLVCITPIYEDIPQFVGTCAQVFEGGHEKLTVELKTDANIAHDINAISQIGGVNTVTSHGLIIHTLPFSDNISDILDRNMEYLYPNLTSWSIDNKNGIININVSDNNPDRASGTLKGPLYDRFNITYSYSVIELEVDAKANSVDHIISQLDNHDVVVTDVEGPVNSIMDATAKYLPSNEGIVLISAILGAVFSILGMFIDQIRRGLSSIRNKK